MPRNPRTGGDARHDTADGVRRAAADMALATRQLQHWMADPDYKPRMLTRETRADLTDVRDRLSALLGDYSAEQGPRQPSERPPGQRQPEETRPT